MKKSISSLSLLVILSLTITINSCKEKESDNPYNDEAKQQFEAVMTLQEESATVMEGFMSTMDSVEAVETLAQWFRNNNLVQTATVSSQGISVVYANGIWGGVFMDGGRSDEAPEKSSSTGNLYPDTSKAYYKNTPTKKLAIFMTACYEEFPEANNYQSTKWSNALGAIDFPYARTGNVTLDYLNGCQEMSSVLCFDSHGYAWPSDSEINEVFFQTHETPTAQVNEKYYQDFLDKNLMIMNSIDPPQSRYYISPDFIKKYNDFSKDTVLFYGGFCYSFLGTWPSLVDACASGTYFGFDWIVRSNKCALWAVDLVEKMADKEAAKPWTVEEWMTNSTIEKQYFDEAYNKTIHILYEGNSNLTLWEPVFSAAGSIEALAEDGAPIETPGLTCQEYTLRCNVKGQLPPQVIYNWDLGTGWNYGQYGNEIICLYIIPGNYTINVQVINDATSEIIEELSAQVLFEDPSFLPVLQTLQINESSFNPSCIALTNGTTLPNGYLSYNTDDAFTTPLTWNGSTFFAQLLDIYGSFTGERTLSGEISPDGKTIVYMKWSVNEKNNGTVDLEASIEVANLPVFIRDEWNCYYGFEWNLSGAETQTYVTDIQYNKYDYQTQQWITIQNIDWNNSYFYGRFLNEK